MRLIPINIEEAGDLHRERNIMRSLTKIKSFAAVA